MLETCGSRGQAAQPFPAGHSRRCDRRRRPAFGSLTAANAQAGHPTSQPPSIEQQAARVHAEDAYTPVNGNAEMNLGVLEDQIEHYYGSPSATFRGSARLLSRLAPATTPGR